MLEIIQGLMQLKKEMIINLICQQIIGSINSWIEKNIYIELITKNQRMVPCNNMNSPYQQLYLPMSF
ncbi:unnamed protein product [Paramecium octaurelia]|uniref:Uncharacterized protein n=1 Tax=Paramecium octaurelia TaxID=43137 RepID=A0A8S1TCN9_PAROT|nr:unnamed protein product [Paramecium octaurelia]